MAAPALESGAAPPAGRTPGTGLLRQAARAHGAHVVIGRVADEVGPPGWQQAGQEHHVCPVAQQHLAAKSHQALSALCGQAAAITTARNSWGERACCRHVRAETARCLALLSLASASRGSLPDEPSSSSVAGSDATTLLMQSRCCSAGCGGVCRWCWEGSFGGAGGDELAPALRHQRGHGDSLLIAV